MLLVLVRPGEIINVTNLGFCCCPPLLGGQRVLLNKFSSSANAVFAITIAMRKNFSDLIVDVLVILANAKPFDEQNVKGNTTSALKTFLFKTRRRIALSKWCNAHKIVQNRSVCSISSALNAFFRECSL